jgi:RNA polymerase sigma-70 factor, ECF subfamily
MSEDCGIVKQVLDGNTDAFRLVVERYNRPVISMVRNIINNPAEAEDIAQEVFIAAFNKLHTFDIHRSLFSTWLFTIARNKSITQLRKQQVRKRAESKYQQPVNNDESGNDELLNRLNIALEKIPIKQKTAFVLAHFEDLPYEQIAQIEGVSIGTIRSRINRAKNKLTFALKESNGDN